MKICKVIAIIIVLMGSVVAQAVDKIGFVDWQKVLLESKAAKVYIQKNKVKYQSVLNALEEKKEKIKSEENKLKKNNLSMSKEEIEKKNEELNKDKNNFYQEYQKIRMEKELADNEQLKELEPKLKQAIKNISESNKFFLVFDKTAVLFHSSDLSDLTEKVVDELNKITDSHEESDQKKEPSKK